MTAPRDVKVVAWMHPYTDAVSLTFRGDPWQRLILEDDHARALADVEAENERLRESMNYWRDAHREACDKVVSLTATVGDLDVIKNAMFARAREWAERCGELEAALAAATALLREAEPFVGWTGAPDGLTKRIGDYLDAALAGKGKGS